MATFQRATIKGSPRIYTLVVISVLSYSQVAFAQTAPPPPPPPSGWQPVTPGQGPAATPVQVPPANSAPNTSASAAVPPPPPPPPPPPTNTVGSSALVPVGSTLQALLNIPSVGSPLSIYVPAANGTWSLTCYTPCTLRVPVGNVTIATLPNGSDAVTLPVPPEGRSYQPAFVRQGVINSNTPNPSGMSSADSLRAIGVAPATGGAGGGVVGGGGGMSAGAAILLTGVGLTVVGTIVGTVAFVEFISTPSFTGPWFGVFLGSSIATGIGGLLMSIGWQMGVSWSGGGRSAIGFAPILTPQVQGAGLTVRF